MSLLLSDIVAPQQKDPFPGQWVEVSRTVVSTAVATVDFTGIDSSADEWAVAIYNAIPATDGGTLMCRTSSDNGASFDSGASDYRVRGRFDAAVSDSGIYINYFWGAGNAANETGVCSEVKLTRPAAAEHTRIDIFGSAVDDVGNPGIYFVAAHRTSAAAVNAIRFYEFSGDISSGTFVLLKRIKP
jgi:hypothetical protein